jgi:hypothetical protein
MHEQPQQIVEPFSEELGDWVHIERGRAERFLVCWQRHLSDLDLAPRAP